MTIPGPPQPGSQWGPPDPMQPGPGPSVPLKTKSSKAWPIITAVAVVFGIVGISVAATSGKSDSSTTAASIAPTTTSESASAAVTKTVVSTEKATALTSTVTVTATETAEQAAAPAPVTTEPVAPSTTDSSSSLPTFKTKTFKGSGDDVVKLGDFSDIAILTFKCEGCDGNVVLESDGGESLLVNAIGSYSGQHLINTQTGSMTTKLDVTADSDWTITIEDLSHVSKATKGTGDSVILLEGPGDTAKITNHGDGNFVVQSYGDDSELLVNEIGSYSGTVSMTLPAVVQVTSDGTWSFAVS